MPKVIFNGQVGRLEGVYTHSLTPTAPLAIILHPNPLQGGTMNNKVTCALHRAFVDAGCAAMRFNFRGVGNSEGAFTDGEGELNDTIFALDWLNSIHGGNRPIWIAGYSFGAWVGMQLLMRRPEIKGFISVSPPVNIYDFSFLAPCPVPGLLINGDNDVICPGDEVNRLAEKLRSQKQLKIDYKIIPDCDHSYDNKLDVLKEIVIDYIRASNEMETISQAV